MGKSLVRFNPTPAQLLGSFAIFGCLSVDSASAAIVPLVPGNLGQSFPDVTVSMINVRYDTDTDLLHLGVVPGRLLTIDQDGVLPSPDHTIFNSSFNVFVTINNAGLASSATLSLSGNYDSLGGPAVSLQSNTLTGFGFDTSTGIFSLIFDNTTGNLPGFGSLIGISLAGNFPASIPSGFGSEFSNAGPLGGLGNADVFAPIPEPSSIIAWSIGSALAGLVGWRRARKSRKAI